MTRHYETSDAVFSHLDAIVPTLPAMLQSQYVGFAAVSAVTVYELAIKDVFVNFSQKKHKTFGHFVAEHFRRINGRIGLNDLRTIHIVRFGRKYLERFDFLLEMEEKKVLLTDRKSIKSSYGNLIEWRNSFAHEGQPPRNATYDEVAKSYEMGKKVINCLANAMVR